MLGTKRMPRGSLLLPGLVMNPPSVMIGKVGRTQKSSGISRRKIRLFSVFRVRPLGWFSPTVSLFSATFVLFPNIRLSWSSEVKNVAQNPPKSFCFAVSVFAQSLRQHSPLQSLAPFFSQDND